MKPPHATAVHHVPVLQLAAEVHQLDVLHARRLFTQHYMMPTTMHGMITACADLRADFESTGHPVGLFAVGLAKPFKPISVAHYLAH